LTIKNNQPQPEYCTVYQNYVIFDIIGSQGPPWSNDHAIMLQVTLSPNA